MVTIYFDLDGTIYDLYSMPDWLELLDNERPTAFSKGDFLPYIDKKEFYSLCGDLVKLGVKIGVITWLPKNATKEYNAICTKEKENWCKENLPFISSFKALNYGTEKRKGITKKSKTIYLIDDNKEVCEQWETKSQRKFYNVNKEFNIVSALREILNSL